MSDASSYNRNVVILAGPELARHHHAYLERLKTAFQRGGARVVMAGDGIGSVTLPMIEQAFAAADPHLPTTLYVDANGKDVHGAHELLLDKTLTGNGLPMADILKTAARYFSRAPVDVFLATCAAENILRHVSCLPEGSTAVSLTPGRLNYHDLVRFSLALERNANPGSDHSAQGLLRIFLLSEPVYPIATKYAVSSRKLAPTHLLAAGPV